MCPCPLCEAWDGKKPAENENRSDCRKKPSGISSVGWPWIDGPHMARATCQNVTVPFSVPRHERNAGRLPFPFSRTIRGENSLLLRTFPDEIINLFLAETGKTQGLAETGKTQGLAETGKTQGGDYKIAIKESTSWKVNIVCSSPPSVQFCSLLPFLEGKSQTSDLREKVLALDHSLAMPTGGGTGCRISPGEIEQR